MNYAEVRTDDGVVVISEQEYLLKIFVEPPDADRFKPQCCNGVGYVRRFRPLGHFEFGQIERCIRCHPGMPTQSERSAPWAK